jgi:hypothetical protein
MSEGSDVLSKRPNQIIELADAADGSLDLAP